MNLHEEKDKIINERKSFFKQIEDEAENLLSIYEGSEKFNVILSDLSPFDVTFLFTLKEDRKYAVRLRTKVSDVNGEDKITKCRLSMNLNHVSNLEMDFFNEDDTQEMVDVFNKNQAVMDLTKTLKLKTNKVESHILETWRINHLLNDATLRLQKKKKEIKENAINDFTNDINNTFQFMTKKEANKAIDFKKPQNSFSVISPTISNFNDDCVITFQKFDIKTECFARLSCLCDSERSSKADILEIMDGALLNDEGKFADFDYLQEKFNLPAINSARKILTIEKNDFHRLLEQKKKNDITQFLEKKKQSSYDDVYSLDKDSKKRKIGLFGYK